MRILRLDAGDIDGGWAFAKVLATMIHPEDARARGQLLVILWADLLARIKEGIKDAGEIGTPVSFTLSIGDLSHVLQMLRQGPSEDKVFAYMRRAFYRGYLAGRILQLMGRIQATGKDPSVTKAIYLLGDILLEWQTQTGQTLPRSRKEMYSAWRDFKSVAHFWAAYYLNFPQDHVDRLCCTTCAHMARADASPQCLTHLLSPKPCVFLLFLALSDSFRCWGSDHAPHHQRNPSPWLDPSTTWRCEVPSLPLYRLPCVELSGYPLTDEHTAVLLKYKANNRF